MKKILVAIDGSTPASHAARFAWKLAQPFGAELTFVYVTPLPLVPAEAPFAERALVDELHRAGDLVLEQAVRALDAPHVAKRNLVGTPAEVVVELAENENFDLVVVGSKGRGAVARVLVGSVTDRLVHSCKKPVLVVR